MIGVAGNILQGGVSSGINENDNGTYIMCQYKK